VAGFPDILRAYSPDAIAFFGYYESVGHVLLDYLDDQGISLPVFGGDAFGEEEIFSRPITRNIFFSYPHIEKTGELVDAFMAAFNRLYGSEPELNSYFGFDSLGFLVKMLGNSKADGAELKEVIDNADDFYVGVTGPKVFTE